MATIDQAVRRVLRIKYRLGLFEHPYADEGLEKATLLSPANLAAARELAARTFVLLKNDHETLPLSPATEIHRRHWPAGRRRAKHDRPVERRRPQGGRGHFAGRHSRRTSTRRRSTMPGAATSPAIRARVLMQAINAARESDFTILAVGESADMSPARRLPAVRSICRASNSN